MKTLSLILAALLFQGNAKAAKIDVGSGNGDMLKVAKSNRPKQSDGVYIPGPESDDVSTGMILIKCPNVDFQRFSHGDPRLDNITNKGLGLEQRAKASSKYGIYFKDIEPGNYFLDIKAHDGNSNAVLGRIFLRKNQDRPIILNCSKVTASSPNLKAWWERGYDEVQLISAEDSHQEELVFFSEELKPSSQHYLLLVTGKYLIRGYKDGVPSKWYSFEVP